MAIRLTKTSKIIFGVLIVLLAAGLGYLVWRVNQVDQLDPGDSDAASCSDYGCYSYAGGRCYLNDGDWEPDDCPAGCYKQVNGRMEQCDTDGGGGTCARLANDGGAVGSRCSGNNCEGGQSCGTYTYECGTWCYDPSCGASACGEQTPVTYTLTYTAGSGGSISGTTPQTVNSGSNGTEVEAKPNSGYSFVSWSDGVTTAKRTDTNVTANVTVSATFQIKKYTLKYSSGSNGSVSGTLTQSVNHGSNGSKVTAQPSTNYRFASWSDGVTTAERTDTNVTKDITAIAQFTTIGTYSLTYSTDGNGSISGTTPQSVNHGGSGTEVSAVPKTGFSFVKWSDGVMTATRTDTNVTKDIVAIATFSAECGNGICGTDENASNCPADCEAVCGDGFCTHSESNSSCPADCAVGTVPQTGIFDSTIAKIAGGFVLILLGVFVYISPVFPLSMYIKNGKVYISNRNTQKRRLIFENRFK